jgi:site-specific recombinase XerD
LFSSGARISELLQLDRDSIVLNEFGEGEAQIEGKGNKPGVLTFDSNALKILNDYTETRNDPIRPLFISGQRRRITVSRVEQLCHEYADMAGIDKNVTPHVWRHTFASDLKLNGADIYDISKQLRHSNIATTMIYTHISDQKKANDYRKYHTSTPIN